MAKEDFTLIKELKDIFPEGTWAWAIPGLRREGLVWGALRDEHFRRKARHEIGIKPEKWTPARLGVLAAKGDGYPKLTWPLPPFRDLSPEIRQKVYQTYQESTQTSPTVDHLSRTLFLALGIKQEKDAGKSWEVLLGEIHDLGGWRGVLVCLYELLDSPTTLLKTLPDRLGLHVLLARSIPPAALKERLRGHLTLFSRSKQLAWLELLREEKPELSAQLAKTLTSQGPGEVNTITEMLQESRMYHASGDLHSALQLLNRASSIHDEIKSSLAAQINTLQAQAEAPQLSSTTWEDFLATVSDPVQLEKHIDEINELLEALLERNFAAAAENVIETLAQPLPEHPRLLSNLADFALSQGETEKARGLALQALDAAGEELTAPPLLPELLLEMGLHEEAIQAAQSTLASHPDRPDTMAVLAKAEDQVGDHAHAVAHGQVALLHQPDNVDLRRQFATYLEHGGEWEGALGERSAVLAQLQGDQEAKSTFAPVLPQDDLHALAYCAYRADQPARSIKVCENLLEQDPEDGLAHVTLGKSLRAAGREEEGFKHLQIAADTSPELPHPWLALADGYREQGDPEKALQTLKMGANAADKTAKLYLALGKLQDTLQAPSEALEAFQKSAQLAQDEGVDRQTQQEIGYHLGKSYYQLGHLTKARDTLRDLKDRFPGNQKTHLIYGRVLLEMDEPRGALPYLAQVVDAQPQDAGPYIDYADAHLRIGANPKIAIKSLNQALDIAPADQKALALLAEAYRANGEHQRAMDQFRESMDSELSQDPTWGPRITIGFSKTALALGETETALATLKEGFTSNPHNLALAHMLAQAYAKAELTQDALSTAKKALDIAPDDVDNLAWVSDFALQLDSPQHAITALEEMITLNPDETSTYIKLGKAYRQQGRPEKAKDTLAKISQLDHATPEGLYQAGDELLKLGDISEGMDCLERAANISQSNDNSPGALPKIWARLADGWAMNGDQDQALTLLDQAIEADLDQPLWRMKKADLLVDQERYQAALASLKNALDLNPQNPTLHHRIARVYRQVNDHPAAVDHAHRAVLLAHDSGEIEDDDFARYLAFAADLALSTVQFDLAYDILLEGREGLISSLSTAGDEAVHALCTLGELSLRQDQEVQAADLLNHLLQEQGDHPRVKVLQARVLTRRGKYAQSQGILEGVSQEEVDSAPITEPYRSSTYLALAEGLRELERWDEALDLIRQAARVSPGEIRAQLALTQALVRRGETYRFAQTLKAIYHTPGPKAVSEGAKQDFQQGLASLKETTQDSRLVRKWALRGSAVFQPSPESTDALQGFAEDRDDLAALLASLRDQHRMDQAAKRAIGNYDKMGESAFFDAQVALSILHIKPDKALEAARSARDINRERFHLLSPMYHVLLALAAEKNGDRELAYHSVMEALDTWDDEPRWHALAASYGQTAEDSIHHLERAVQLEPDYPGHHLALGKTYLNFNEPEAGIDAFEEVISLTPEQVDAWTHLARCHRQLGDFGSAMECAQQAVEVSPGHLPARRVLAEIALEKGEHPVAERHLKELVAHRPQDPQALALLSQSLAAQKRPREALEVIDKAISLDGEALELKLQRADLIQETDGISAAIDALRVIGSHHPDEYQVVSQLVGALAAGGETEQAIQTAKTILSKDDVGHTASQKADLHLLTGRLLRKTGQLDQAVHHFNEVKKLDPQAHEAYLELGRTHLDRRQYDRALERINKAIELAPEQPMAYFYAGKVLKELKEYERAERMLRQASKLAPNDLRIHRQLGVLVTLNLVHGNRRKEGALS